MRGNDKLLPPMRVARIGVGTCQFFRWSGRSLVVWLTIGSPVIVDYSLVVNASALDATMRVFSMLSIWVTRPSWIVI